MSDRPLEISGDELRRLVDTAARRIAEHIDTLADQPAWNSDGAAELARSIAEPLPQHATSFESLLDDLFGRFVNVTFNTASPGYVAFIPTGGIVHAGIADLIANTINRYVGVWIAAPALVQIETNVVRWFCEMMGYGKESGGFLTTGGSLANWSAIVTARQCRVPDDFSKATVYTSNQAHHSVLRAAMLAGIPKQNIRAIDVDDRFCVRVDRLVDQIHEDRSNGLKPLAIVANAGTTNSGAVDDLDALADLAERENVWYHIDAAYGGFFMLTERGRKVLKGIERADSIALDPSKTLFLPYGTGCLVCRRLEDLRTAYSISADYMPSMQDQSEFVDFCSISPELSRDFRGLRVWLPLKMHGIEPFRANLDEKLDLIQWAHDELCKLNDDLHDELEIVAEPQLTVVAFRLLRSGMSELELTRLNEQFRDRINASRRVYLTPTILDGRYVIRICVLSFRTHQDRMDECLAEIRNAAKSLA